MPPLETMSRFDDAVLWVKIGNDRQGEPIVAEPVCLKVTANFTSRNSMQADGNVKSSDAQVVVNREIAVDSILWFGRYCDLPSSTEDAVYYTVVDNAKTPDLKHRAVNTMYKVTVKRFRGRLPAVRSVV